MQNSDSKTRLTDCEQIQCLLKHMITYAAGIDMATAQKQVTVQEQELFRDHVYEDAVSGTDAAGPALERIHSVYQGHWDRCRRFDLSSSIADGIEQDGLAAALSPEEAEYLSEALEPIAGQLLDRFRALADEANEMGIYDLMPQPLTNDGLEAAMQNMYRAMDLIKEQYGEDDKAVRLLRQLDRGWPYER
ncbi:hypothetical protein [uncultured Alistipes sp.]|jgi:hypothetical protein|uniref:hypothetical protein n=1 Tax=uncultured Alistipes sp. TaxID=538949 RepID=UPI00272BA501|nr:hypothetical protein [uncultured Alistipes sp.]